MKEILVGCIICSYGMSVGSKNGIYFDLPDFNTVQALEDFLVSKK